MAPKRWQNAKYVVQDGLRIKPDQLHAYRALLDTPAVRTELHVFHVTFKALKITISTNLVCVHRV